MSRCTCVLPGLVYFLAELLAEPESEYANDKPADFNADGFGRFQCAGLRRERIATGNSGALGTIRLIA